MSKMWTFRSDQLTQLTPPGCSRPKSIVWSTESSRLARIIRTTWLRISDLLIEWTPCILVVCYWIVTTAIFVMCSSRAIEVFYYFYMTANLYVAACAAVESFLGLTPVREARQAADKIDANGGQFPTADTDLPSMDLVMVAYLPNEKDIVLGQIKYMLDELAYPREKLRISERPRLVESEGDADDRDRSGIQHAEVHRACGIGAPAPC
jgi:hypothetical protein